MIPTSECATPSKNETPLLSVVLPVYNEVAVLPRLLESLRGALAACGLRHEIVFVNDGSNDGSGKLLDHFAAQDASVRVLHLSRNFGHQPALQAGLAHARGDAVVVMDSDLQDVPAAIPAFVVAWRNGYDVVYAIRTDRKESAVKRMMFSAFYRLLAAVSSTPLPLDAGNFGLMDRRVVRDVVALGERDRYFAGLRSWVGYRQLGIPVERGARYDDRPRVTWWGLCRLAKSAIFSFSTLPLTVFYLIGCMALLIFLGLSAFSLYCRLFTDLAIPGWTTHVVVGCFFGALNALGVSILGEYVVRIYDQVRARPLYLIEREVNADAASVRPTTTVVPGMSTDVTPSPASETELDALYGSVLQEARSLARVARKSRRTSGGKKSRKAKPR